MRRLVVEPGDPGGPPHVRADKIVRWKFVGAAEPEPTAEEVRDDLMLSLRDQGVGPEPIASFEDDGEVRWIHLDWPDLGTWLLDPEYARTLALASIPLGREIPELDSQPDPDPGHEAEVERQAAEDREQQAAVARVGEAIAVALHAKRAALRRMRRAARIAAESKAKQSPRVIYETENGRDWTRFIPGPRLRARTRVRRPRDGQ
jgi:hypothetical protein